MKTFVVDESSLRKCWGADGQYWFSLDNYSISEHSSFAHNTRPEELTEEAFMLSLGYIPYFRVRRLDLAKAFVLTIPNMKLRNAMDKISDEDYIEAFWKYYNVYPSIFAQYESFQNDYLLKNAIKWCENNHIRYEIRI